MAAMCALCLSDKGPFTKEPFGKNDALVDVCEECNDIHPNTGRYSFSGGRSQGPYTTNRAGRSITARKGK